MACSMRVGMKISILLKGRVYRNDREFHIQKLYDRRPEQTPVSCPPTSLILSFKFGTNGWSTCPFSISKWTWPSGSPSIPQFLLQDMAGITHFVPWDLQPSSSWYNAAILVICLFVPLASWLPSLVSLSLPFLTWLRVMTAMGSPRCLRLWLCSPFYLQ